MIKYVDDEEIYHTKSSSSVKSIRASLSSGRSSVRSKIGPCILPGGSRLIPGTFQLNTCHNICGWHSPLGPCPMFATKLNIICQISQFFCNRRLLSCLRTSRDEYSVIPEMFSTVLSTSMLNDIFFINKHQCSILFSI